MELDLRKAYDTINHTILIKKLEKYGIRGLPLQLLASYLTDRQQYMLTVSFVYTLYKVYISLQHFVLILHKIFYHRK